MFLALSGRFWGLFTVILFMFIFNQLCKIKHFILNL